MKNEGFQEVWEKLYASGHSSKYPWDVVVTFIFRNRCKLKDISENHLLEVGFGAGNNLWCAAREGFKVSGIEGSSTAVSIAKKRFQDDSLEGDLRIGTFTKLPFEDNFFDLAVDRGSLVCVNKSNQIKAIREIRRCLNIGGKFLFVGYGDTNTSVHSGELSKDGITKNITEGSMAGFGDLTFISVNDIKEFFCDGWEILSLKRVETIDLINKKTDIHSEWHVIAEKKGK